MDKENLVKAFVDFLDKNFGGTQAVVEDTVEVVKALDEELKQATFVALVPDEVDLHGDIYSSEEVTKACHNYNTKCSKTNLGHIMMIDDSVASVVESYITLSDLQIGETLVKKGSWLQVWQFADDDLWTGVKKGYWTGISVGCYAQEEILDDES